LINKQQIFRVNFNGQKSRCKAFFIRPKSVALNTSFEKECSFNIKQLLNILKCIVNNNIMNPFTMNNQTKPKETYDSDGTGMIALIIIDDIIINNFI
jgi:hypothetical protein